MTIIDDQYPYDYCIIFIYIFRISIFQTSNTIFERINLKKKLTIIIPTYNVEQYIRQCLTSIQKQTFPSLEIICLYPEGDEIYVKFREVF